MPDELALGDLVTPRISLCENLSEEGMGISTLAYPGERLIIRDFGTTHDYQVSHETRTDGMTFGCNADEIAKIKQESTDA